MLAAALILVLDATAQATVRGLRKAEWAAYAVAEWCTRGWQHRVLIGGEDMAAMWEVLAWAEECINETPLAAFCEEFPGLLEFIKADNCIAAVRPFVLALDEDLLCPELEALRQEALRQEAVHMKNQHDEEE